MSIVFTSYTYNIVINLHLLKLLFVEINVSDLSHVLLI